MSAVNERLREVRQALGLTQEKMASVIGLTKGGVCDIETSQRKVAARHIKMYVMMFGVNEHWVLTGEGEMFLDRRALLKEALERQWQLSSEEATFVVNFVYTPPEQRQQIAKAFGSLKNLGQ